MRRENIPAAARMSMAKVGRPGAARDLHEAGASGVEGRRGFPAGPQVGREPKPPGGIGACRVLRGAAPHPRSGSRRSGLGHPERSERPRAVGPTGEEEARRIPRRSPVPACRQRRAARGSPAGPGPFRAAAHRWGCPHPSRWRAGAPEAESASPARPDCWIPGDAQSRCSIALTHGNEPVSIRLSALLRRRSSVVEQLIRNQQVGGSIPLAGFSLSNGIDTNGIIT